MTEPSSSQGQAVLPFSLMTAKPIKRVKNFFKTLYRQGIPPLWIGFGHAIHMHKSAIIEVSVCALLEVVYRIYK